MLRSEILQFGGKVILIGKGDPENVQSVGVESGERVLLLVHDGFLEVADLGAV
jgi:hypothetical protein